MKLRLVLATAVALSIVFAAMGAALYAAMRASLRAEFDQTLGIKARALASMTERRGDLLFLDDEHAHLDEFAAGKHAQYFQIWQTDGPGGPRVVARSPSLTGGDLGRLDAPGELTPAFSDGRLPGGKRGRYVAISYAVSPEADDREKHGEPMLHAMLVVGAESHGYEHTAERLGWLLAAGCGAATVVAVVAVGLLIGRGLRPVNQVASAIAGVGHETLSERLTEAGVPRELRPIVRRINELLARLESAFARERALTADVAHELRTPLAGVRAALEVCTGRRREPAEYERTIGRCVVTVDRLQAMVNNLLRLARLEGEERQGQGDGEVDVPELVVARWEDFAARGAERGLSVKWELPDGGAAARGDEESLRVIVDNLFDNAVSYAAGGTAIRVSVRNDGGGVCLEVANAGSELTTEQASQVFDRFWRGDASRAAAGVHCGLGMTLVKRIVEGLGGRIEVCSERGGQFVVAVQLSAAAGAGTSSTTAVSASV